MPFVPQYHPVTRPLYLREYAQAYGDQHLDVWVNPPRAMLDRYHALLEEFVARGRSLRASTLAMQSATDGTLAADAMREQDDYNAWQRDEFVPKMDAWFADLWSQAGEVWTAEDVHKFYDMEDQALAAWIKRRCLDLIDAHRAAAQKKT